MSVDVSYFDYAKAFDCLPHQRLLHKLAHFGVRGRLLSWISSFFSSTTFSVKVSHHYSLGESVLSCLPQGSVLEPGLTCVLQSNFAFYVVNLKIYANHSLERKKLEDDQTILSWNFERLWPMNVHKSTILHIGSINPKIPYTVYGVFIKPVDTQNNLGVIIKSNLSWLEHVTSRVFERTVF